MVDEQNILQTVLLEHIREQRRARRWSMFFKLIFVGFLIYLFTSFYNRDLPQPISLGQPHTAVIDVYGEIAAEDPANADDIRDALRTAFTTKQVKGVILRINSPGGSPVQARQIFSEIRNLKKQHPHIKIYAAIEDLGTSAAYLIAAAVDNIYADKTSIVGSIGVKIDSFGYVEGMKKIGVERRLYTAGKYKGILDPFSPRNPEEEGFINEQLRTVHMAFIENVREGRGNRLRETPDIFSGLFWSGEQALTLGLIDGFGDAQFIAKELIKIENLVDYTPNPTLLDKLARRMGASIGQTLLLNAGLIQKGAR
ncbi:MAG TPA: S49 family peptidase [Gammaproteobacteria bacterium]|nr:S49 family peptidase [Gammaproteobacteria bacterium]